MRFLKILSIRLIDSFEVSRNITRSMKANRVKLTLSARFSEILVELVKKRKDFPLLRKLEFFTSNWEIDVKFSL